MAAWVHETGIIDPNPNSYINQCHTKLKCDARIDPRIELKLNKVFVPKNPENLPKEKDENVRLIPNNIILENLQILQKILSCPLIRLGPCPHTA